MDPIPIQAIISLIIVLGAGIGVWVAMNNKVTRLETKVEMMEKSASENKDQNDKSMGLLRSEMLHQFQLIREDLHKMQSK
jgi:hypothetical protein